MTKLNYPITSGKSKTMGFISNSGEKFITSANVLRFPIEVVHCTSCRIPFRRRQNKQWKNLCIQCWLWQRVFKHHARMRNLLRAIQ